MSLEYPGPHQSTKDGQQPVRLSNVQSFAELRSEGFTPYSVGPLYVHVSVPDNLAVRFASELKDKKNLTPLGSELSFADPVLSDCAEWDYMLDAMDTKSFGIFKGWLCSLRFVRKDPAEYYGVRHYQAPIIDPIDKVSKTYLDIFCPVCQVWTMKPLVTGIAYDQAPLQIRFTKAPGDPNMAAEGRVATQTL